MRNSVGFMLHNRRFARFGIAEPSLELFYAEFKRGHIAAMVSKPMGKRFVFSPCCRSILAEVAEK